MNEKLNPYYKLLEAETAINITSKPQEPFDSAIEARSDACKIALKQPLPGKPLVLMSAAIFKCAGYACMIEVNPD